MCVLLRHHAHAHSAFNILQYGRDISGSTLVLQDRRDFPSTLEIICIYEDHHCAGKAILCGPQFCTRFIAQLMLLLWHAQWSAGNAIFLGYCRTSALVIIDTSTSLLDLTTDLRLDRSTYARIRALSLCAFWKGVPRANKTSANIPTMQRSQLST